MGPGPRSGSARWLGSLGVVAAVVTACGAAPAPSVSARATASPAASSIAAPPTLPVLPPPAPIAPLVGESATGSFSQSLYTAAGVRTATLPSSPLYSPLSPLGDRLLAAQDSPLTSNGFYNVAALVAISASGAVSRLETISDPADYIDAIGSEDGTQWAWMMKGPFGGCAGTPPPPTDTYVYISAEPGKATLLAKLPPLKPAGEGWTFHRWTAAGIVISEGDPPGCYDGPPIQLHDTELLNPATGTVTPLAPTLGAGDCILQDIADNGTVACIPSAVINNDTAPKPSATVLRIVFPGGAERDVPAAPLLQGCDPSGQVLFGGVFLSSGPELVSLDRWCSTPHNGNELIDIWIIDIETLNMVKVSVTNLGATGWLPGTTTLIATGDIDFSAQSTSGTYVVAGDGTATKLTAADIEPESFAHF